MAFTRPKQRNPPPLGGSLSKDSGITALIDADIISYSIGFACQQTIREVWVKGETGIMQASFESAKEMDDWLKGFGHTREDFIIKERIEPEPLANCLHAVKVFMNSVLEATNAQYYKAYLTGSTNFRYDRATITEYKAGRAAKPYHHASIRDYLIKQWSAEVIEGAEADDMLAVELTKDPEKNVLCSIDKDLLQVKGHQYQWNHPEKGVFYIDEWEGLYRQYHQCLTGDRTDCIVGIVGIGPKKADKILEDCKTEEELYWATLYAYENSHYEKPFEAMWETMDLIYMIREINDKGEWVLWMPPH